MFFTEIILEPMRRFVVKNARKLDNLTIVVLEPIEEPLLFEDEIPSGCIQHIISNLMENGESKEICDMMCDILCNINMNDDISRN